MKKKKTSIMMGTLMLMLGAVSLSSCATLNHIEPIGLYTVSVASSGGASVTLSKETANPGEVITVTVALRESDRLYVTGVSAGYRVEVVDQGGGVYKFQMPNRNVEVKVETASYDLADEAHLAKLSSSNLDVKGTIEVVRRVGEQEAIVTEIISSFIGQESAKTNIIDTEGNAVVDRTYYKGEDGTLTREFINENNEVEVIEMMLSSTETAPFSLVSNPFAKLTTEDLVADEDGYVIEDEELLKSLPSSLIYYTDPADSLKFVPVDEKTVNFTYMADLGSSVENDIEFTMSVTGTITISEQADIPHLEPYKPTQASVAVDAALDELKDTSYTLERTMSLEGQEVLTETLFVTPTELVYKYDISEDVTYYYGAQNFDDTWYYFDIMGDKAIYDLDEPYTGSVLPGQSEVLGVLFEESEVTGTYTLKSEYAASGVAITLEDALFLEDSYIDSNVTNALLLDYYGLVSNVELTIANGHLVSYGYDLTIQSTSSQTYLFEFDYEVSNIGKTTSPVTLSRIKPTVNENNYTSFNGTYALAVSETQSYLLDIVVDRTNGKISYGDNYIYFFVIVCYLFDMELYDWSTPVISNGILSITLLASPDGQVGYYIDVLLVPNPAYGNYYAYASIKGNTASTLRIPLTKIS